MPALCFAVKMFIMLIQRPQGLKNILRIWDEPNNLPRVP